MLNIKIHEKLKELCPQLKLGCIEANVKVEESSISLLNEINIYCNDIINEIKLEDLSLSLIHICFPISVPDSIVALIPIHTCSPTIISFLVFICFPDLTSKNL